MGPKTYHYIKFFVWRVGYKSLGALCHHTMAVTDHSNTTMLFVVVTFQTLIAALTNQCQYVIKCQGLIQHPFTSSMCVMSHYINEFVCIYQYHLLIFFIGVVLLGVLSYLFSFCLPAY